MDIQNKREPLILFLGDVIFLYIALFLMLMLSYSGLPSERLLVEHISAFTFIFIVWIFVFFVGGLYEKHTLLFKNKLPTAILNTQLVNTVIAVIFFYLIPYFGITPKTNLFIYLIISFALVLFWRIYGYQGISTGRKEKALIIGRGKEMTDLVREVNNNSRYTFFFVGALNLDEEDQIEAKINNQVVNNNVQSVVVDLNDVRTEPLLPKLYNLIYSGVKFFDKHRVYEEIFDKIPLSILGYNWFLDNISLSPKPTFDFFKRVLDVLVSLVLGVFSLIITPFVIFAIKFEDGGRSLIVQERVGQNNKLFKIYKFRTMERDDSGESVKETKVENEITKVGSFLRKARIDELPQLWNVLRGDLSLIGPRPELPSLAKTYTEEVPYYNIRHLVKPGLSGWGQIKDHNVPRMMADVEKTKTKLSYDLYYIKNRSIMLDLKIALRTIKVLLSRSGV